ncbi:MAG: glucose-6-phosphate isomerase [Oscillospiraceae bacterium]|jgi:glucose-6-phosphate isomerase|nr:glucose-6-phosphate isomerase [Oscillospiraceae bacterium]
MALKLSTRYADGQLPTAAEESNIFARARQAHQALEEGTGKGAGMRGWLRFPSAYVQTEEYAGVQRAAQTIRHNADVLLVVGIGGSYLGARAVVEAVKSRYYNQTRHGVPEVYFTGNTLSEADFADLEQLIAGKDFYINVISKSGKTLECAVAFRHFKSLLEEKWGGNRAEVNRRIFATTDAHKGTLLEEAQANGWQTFVVPTDMGGRYSVLSAVGLLPIACAGVEVDALLRGAADAQKAYETPGEAFGQNACDDYAALRYYYYKHRRKGVEILASYEPSLAMLGEWYKQLFGESEGKRGRGLFPASVTFTTDLHSLGQYIQQGRRMLFETVLTFDEAANNLAVRAKENDGDGLNYLAGKTLHEINQAAFQATALAHAKGKCPNLVLSLPRRDAYHIGWLIYFFEKACAISGYMIDVNPFDQDGVESYKKFMFALLGKAGKEHDKVRDHLKRNYGIEHGR